MLSFLRQSQPETDAPEEHHISIPGIEMAFNHATKTVMMIDQTGRPDTMALDSLGRWLEKQGWFLHCVAVEGPVEPDVPPSPPPVR